jgi:predicted metal-binding membrane protein
MQLDGYVMFALLFVAGVALVAWEVGRTAKFTPAERVAMEGNDAETLAAAYVAQEGDRRNRWGGMPWELY